ncbi:MAG: hypothetical protein PHX44_10375 [Sulfurimonas sp.]|uniref:hypothetical protein n=1 Tax=Sulfurimonas sp. TaxID=2022749 RepID=UPI002622AC8B|nr:hypothetical protein [Sulfurimonas sp.]MDD2653438.1 hypothetical protein [Sulfurimonas sp.]MDD3452645.1 hypothetical protein [Sulfurimonas sp.]
MKFFAWMGAIIAIVVIALYITAFTPLGNTLVKPIVEAKIQEATQTQSKLETFLLTMSDFEVVLALSDENRIALKGAYSLFSRSFDAEYVLDLKNLQALESFAGQPLRGALFSDGKAKGDMALMSIDGKSTIAQSETSYSVTLADLNPTSIIATVKGAKLASLLQMTAKNPYASADVDMDINFKSIKTGVLDGTVVLKTKEGRLDQKYMLSDFNVTIPNTSFSMNLDAMLQGSDISFKGELLSNLFKITSAGSVTPETLKTDVTYALSVQDLEVLKPLTGADIRGAINLKGSIKGDKERLVVQGVSDLASSDSVFEATLKELQLSTLRAKVANLDVAKLLYMLKQPHYTDGLFSMEADIKDMNPKNLSGQVVTLLTKGVLDTAYLTKAYALAAPMPKTTFDAATTTLLRGSVADTKIDLNSNLANLDVKSAKYNLEDKTLKSDYKLFVSNLEALVFATKERLRGELSANGTVEKGKDLDVTMSAALAGGKMEAKLHNDDLRANMSALKTTKLLYMLYRPEIFDASLGAKLDYNLAQSMGRFDGQISNGVFAKNQTFDLIKQFTKVDMYRENFNGDVGVKMDKENMVVSLDLHSKEAAIKTTDTKLNTKTNQLDADVKIVSKNDSIDAKLSGDIDAPKVSVDLEKFLKSETGKRAVEKLFQKLLK